MSLYLPEQKLGSHSAEGGSSNKFILKGRQTGGMHRGHTWVFRAESHDTMMAWYEDIKALTEKTPEERSQFVRSHSRSLSRSSRRSVSSDGLLDDEDDEEPFAAEAQVYTPGSKSHDTTPRRSQAGGRFPSDIQVNAQRGLQAPHSPSSVSSGFQDQRADPATSAASGALPPPTLGIIHQSQDNHLGYGGTDKTPMDEMPSNAAIANQKAHYDGVNPYTSEPILQQTLQHPQQQGGAYFMPVVTPQTGQEPNSDIDNSQAHSDASRDAPPEIHQESRYNDAIAAENTRLYGDDHANSIAREKTVNGMIVSGEGFPNLGGSVRKPVSVTTDGESLMNDTDEEDCAPIRPTGQTARTESVQTISNLRVPGRYPEGNPI
jgi:hypothetical protein